MLVVFRGPPSPAESAPSATWRYYAYRALSGEWLHRELPLSDVRITPALSGPGALTAVIQPEFAELYGPDGRLLLEEWSTVIVAEAAGQLRGGGILINTEITGSALSLECSGFTAYPGGMPITSTLTWGGATDGTSGNGVDPAAVIRGIWDHVQSQPDGALGVTYDPGFATPYRLGAWYNAAQLKTEDTPTPDPKEIEDPPIPIDRVWTNADTRPKAATGKTVYWQYELPWYDDTEAGAKIEEICQQVPIDFREAWAWADESREAVVMFLQLGYPRLGNRLDGLRFVEGENITEVVTVRRAGDTYANAVAAYGAGEGTKKLRGEAVQRDGRLRRVAAVDAPEVASQPALTTMARDELLRSHQLADITSFVVRDHPNAPIGTFAPGDDVPVRTVVGWQPIELWVRITSFEYSPDTSDITVTCARSDSFRYDGGGQ